jgi:hypothetical protein
MPRGEPAARSSCQETTPANCCRSELRESRPDVTRAQATQRLDADDLQYSPAAFVQGVCAGFPKPCAGRDESPLADSGDFRWDSRLPADPMVRLWRVADLPPDAKPGR